MAMTTDRPATAFAVSILGGIFVLLAGILVGVVGFVVTAPFGGFGISLGIAGVVWGIVIIIAAIMMFERPDEHTLWGIIAIVFSILSWIGAFGGFFIGFLLGLTGGILAIVWTPESRAGY